MTLAEFIKWKTDDGVVRLGELPDDYILVKQRGERSAPVATREVARRTAPGQQALAKGRWARGAGESGTRLRWGWAPRPAGGLHTSSRSNIPAGSGGRRSCN